MSVGFALTFYPEPHLLANSLKAFTGDPKLNEGKLSKAIGVGVLKAKAYILWLGKMGLRDNKKRELTPLGNLILKYDPYFECLGTLWILHYKLASNPEAEVWHLLSNEFLPDQTFFSFYDAIDFLAAKGVRPAKEDKHLKSDVSIFLRSFILEDSFKKTEYIKTENQPKKKITQDKFYVHPPSDISPYLIAYIIFDQKEQKFPNIATITIKELLSLIGNVGRVLSINRKRLEEILKLLSGSQYGRLLDLSTRAGLDQVGLRFKGSPLEILRMYYSKKKNE